LLLLAKPDLSVTKKSGMEAIYEFEVKDMPVTVAVDAQGENIHAIFNNLLDR
jgi:fumarate hydratase class I